VERVLRDYYAGRLGDADLEERLLRYVDEGRFRDICQNALEGLATKTLNLAMLIERRAKAQERRMVPETIARFLREAAAHVPFTLRPVGAQPHTFDPVGSTPAVLRRYEREPNWRLAALANRYPRFSTDRATAEQGSLEWVTPGHPLFEAIRRHTIAVAEQSFQKGACFYSLDHSRPARLDFYRARIVDGTGQVIHERLFAVELAEDGTAALRAPEILGNYLPAGATEDLPRVAGLPEPEEWLQTNVFQPFLDEVRAERLGELERVAEHVELSLTELIQKADEQIGRFAEAAERGDEGARGLLAQAEERHERLVERRQRRREELERQRALTLQGVERLTSVLLLPHPEREAPEVRRLRPDAEVEAIAMRVAMEHERAAGRTVTDVHEKNLGYDLTSLDPDGGELRLIEVKGLGASEGTIILTPNERRVAEDRRDCYWLYVVANCDGDEPELVTIKDPAARPWQPVQKIQHFTLSVAELRQHRS
jgi:hypothetical protein